MAPGASTSMPRWRSCSHRKRRIEPRTRHCRFSRRSATAADRSSNVCSAMHGPRKSTRALPKSSAWSSPSTSFPNSCPASARSASERPRPEPCRSRDTPRHKRRRAATQPTSSSDRSSPAPQLPSSPVPQFPVSQFPVPQLVTPLLRGLVEVDWYGGKPMERASYAARLRYLDADDVDDSVVDFDGLDVRGRDGEKLGDVNGFIVDLGFRPALVCGRRLRWMVPVEALPRPNRPRRDRSGAPCVDARHHERTSPAISGIRRRAVWRVQR